MTVASGFLDDNSSFVLYCLLRKSNGAFRIESFEPNCHSFPYLFETFGNFFLVFSRQHLQHFSKTSHDIIMVAS